MMVRKHKVRMSYTPERGVTLAGGDLFIGDRLELLESMAHRLSVGGTHLVVTPNIDQTIDLESRPDSRAAFDAASLRIIDGMPLVVLARMLGARNVHRTTGADLLPLVAANARANSWKIVVTGGKDRVSRDAARNLRIANPGADVMSIPFPLVDDVNDSRLKAVVDDIRAFAPHIVFLCLGAPKQESWFMEWRDQLPDGIYIGAGAAVDFTAGVSTRAPEWVQRVGLEWTWRLGQEPKRLAKRYLFKGPRFLTIAARSIANRGK